ncbi:Uncharacterised protein [Neisseria meningitidis]|nr:Uncharacterised protein [Neisseria meningitidis]CWR56429.1 Uncharacterised protein [Neisseria meningitidis]CWR94934.1 Uncharacterised protein [Neisseria meningitidis]
MFFILMPYLSVSSSLSSGFNTIRLSNIGRAMWYKAIKIPFMIFVFNGMPSGCGVNANPKPSSIPTILGTPASFAAKVPKITGFAK